MSLFCYKAISVSETTAQTQVPELTNIYPNPLRFDTTIRYSIPRAGRVSLVVYDVAGRRVTTVVNKIQTAGPHTIEWQARDGAGLQLPCGVYFIQFKFHKHIINKKLVINR